MPNARAGPAAVAAFLGHKSPRPPGAPAPRRAVVPAPLAPGV